MNRKVK
jgi:hypothetical protein